MSRFKGVRFYLLLSLIVATPIPIQAVILPQPQQLRQIINSQDLALSWGDIWNRLRRKKTPGGSRGEICTIAPQGLVSSNNEKVNLVIWSDKPLFLWRIKGGKATKIEIFEKGESEVLETLVMSEGKTKIIYKGKLLQPGQSYTWQLSANLGRRTVKDNGTDFQIMDAQKRLSIASDLTKLEALLKQQQASVEKIALEKANYFAQKELWSDVLQQLYSVSKPSQELTETIKNIEAYSFCGDEQALRIIGRVR